MPINGIQSLINYGSVSLIISLRARGVIPDFSPGDWLQTALSNPAGGPMVTYLCTEISNIEGRPFPDVTTGDRAMVGLLVAGGYPSDQLVSAALASRKDTCINAVLGSVATIESPDVVEQIIDRAGQKNIGTILLNFCNAHPEKIACIVRCLINNGNATSLAKVCENATAAAAVRQTPVATLRTLVESGYCSTIETILNQLA